MVDIFILGFIQWYWVMRTQKGILPPWQLHGCVFVFRMVAQQSVNKPSQFSVWLLLHVEDPRGIPCSQEVMLHPIENTVGFFFLQQHCFERAARMPVEGFTL